MGYKYPAMNSDDESSSDGEEHSLMIAQRMASLGLSGRPSAELAASWGCTVAVGPAPLLLEPTLAGVAGYLESMLNPADDTSSSSSTSAPQPKPPPRRPRIVVMAGAGISTAAGIPDFRTPGTGLYDNLQQYALPTPQAVFDLDYFLARPEPFCALARGLFPGGFRPTLSHCFVRLLSDKGLLQRHYTQNIDTLERAAGVPAELLVEAHGSFAQGHCADYSCRFEVGQQWLKDRLLAGEVPRCPQCRVGVVKPDIVFFGEVRELLCACVLLVLALLLQCWCCCCCS
jgi:hypothetical protein